MKIPPQLQFFFSTPSLWIIQLGKDELIFSQITPQGIGSQNQLYLEANTILPNKIANPSSLCQGLQLFCQQKKLTKIRVWFLLPKEAYPLPLLAHELFQFLVSIKNAPVIPEAIMTSPFDKPTQLNQTIFQTLAHGDNYLTMFDRYNKLHPAWWVLITLLITTITIWIAAQLIAQTTPRQLPPQQTSSRKSPSKTTSSLKKNRSLPTIKDVTRVLSIIADTIPATVVLEKFATTPPSTHTKNSTTTINGIAGNLHDLLDFVTTLEQKTQLHCNLSHIKEQSQAKPTQGHGTQSITLYRFSLSIEI